ncbi:NAD-dependent succinate-semialdehyde dehydrogenase [Salinisphaera sp. Q1T1-3]|uniref:NAD-dependent succinate-semialdehyde dehydrogenase n=1 Tax=Salinisphaera sp. Q1T1-3 TaxID=2321229 RepID=UPI000E7428F2|nr:NAD-dependent succinate-semialdehyde dehydrogenase [Salinisphaera sp. Q1T1-3]RJS93272.1 NAD-dependent succinate-semialdehyde dehydrogenase [Salinisphaera sp. Q1T1-3]
MENAYLGGQWQTAGSGARTAVTDPANGETLGQVPDLDSPTMQAGIDAAVAAFADWRHSTAGDRAEALLAWYDGMCRHRDPLAEMMTREQGKPIDEARGEVDYAASFLRWFAEEARRIEGTAIPPEAPTLALGTRREPVGVAAIITPWNFPLAMITRKVGAAIAAGCTTVVNPASETPFCALALARLAEAAGLDAGQFNVLTGSGRTFGETVCADTRVRALSFTGSTHVGRALLAGAADTVKCTSMELGGNAPFIVCDDVDLDRAVDDAIAAKFQTSGQDCVAANRIYVHRKLYDAFVARFVERMNAMPVGHGLDEATAIGPLIHSQAVADVQALADDAAAQGARLFGRPQNEAPGPNFFMPTTIADFTPAMRIAREEAFGPLAAIAPFDDDDAVMAAANDTIYGLASYVYTHDDARIRRFLRGLDYGMVGINTMDITGAQVPFGGVKQSGLGREGGHAGIEAYLETKFYCIGDAHR